MALQLLHRNLRRDRNKLASFSHTNWNLPEIRDPEKIMHRVKNSLDLYNHEEEIYDRVESNPDIPEFTRAHGEKFSCMINRDAANANFRDYTAKEERSEETAALLET